MDVHKYRLYMYGVMDGRQLSGLTLVALIVGEVVEFLAVVVHD